MNKRLLYALLFLAFIFVLYLLIAFFFLGSQITDKMDNVIIGFSEDQSGLSTDGPYVYYGEGVEVYSVVKKAGEFVIEKESHAVENKDSLILECTPFESGHTFSVALEESLTVPPVIYKEPKKLLALSDLEGNFDAFTKILIENRVIDQEYHWVYGNGHLMILGDLFDRGLDVTACLWLIYKLEQEAEKQGGVVHFILGNHEEMILKGDNRYVRNKYREFCKQTGLEYHTLFNEHTELGRWLRTKNVIEKVGNTLYVHAGISQEFLDLELGLEQINSLARKNLGKTREQIIAEETPEAYAIFGSEGPLWYRGYFKGPREPLDLTPVLSAYGVSQMVVGHTTLHEMSKLHEGKVIAIDVKQPLKGEEANRKALLFEGGNFYKILNGQRYSF